MVPLEPGWITPISRSRAWSLRQGDTHHIYLYLRILLLCVALGGDAHHLLLLMRKRLRLISSMVCPKIGPSRMCRLRATYFSALFVFPNSRI